MADETDQFMSDFLVPIVIYSGSLAPGQECTVTVHTRDGTAEGELLRPHLDNAWEENDVDTAL